MGDGCSPWLLHQGEGDKQDKEFSSETLLRVVGKDEGEKRHTKGERGVMVQFEAVLRSSPLGKALKQVREHTVWTSGRRTFQTEGQKEPRP